MTTLDELRRANLQEQRTPGPDRQPRPVTDATTLELATVAPELPAVTAAPAASEAVDPLVERVRAVVTKKRQHATGVKATVDMSPDLFWRVKRYCRDHGNATARQLFLDLMGEFLDAEGY